MSNIPIGSENDPNAPWNEDEGELECKYCGEAITKGFYCDKNCEKADFND